jgi:hypothetical protein
VTDSSYRDVSTALREVADQAGEPRADLVDQARRIGSRRLRHRRLAGLATGVALIAMAGAAMQWAPRGTDRLDNTQPAASSSSAQPAPRRCGPTPKPARRGEPRLELTATFPAQAAGGTDLPVDVQVKPTDWPSSAPVYGGGGSQLILVREGIAVTDDIKPALPWGLDLVPGRTTSFSTVRPLTQCRQANGQIGAALPPGRYELYVVVALNRLYRGGPGSAATPGPTTVGGPWPLTIT